MKTLLCTLALLAFVVAPVAFADEHPTTPTTEAKPEGTAAPTAEAKPAKAAKKAKKGKKAAAKKDESKPMEGGEAAPAPSGN